MLMVNDLIGLGAKRSATPATLSFQAITGDTTNATTYTFTAAAIGSAASNRKVVVCVKGVASVAATISSVTIGGATATEAIQNSDAKTTVGIFHLAVSSGTTADIVVTFSAGCVNAAIGVYAVYGAASATSATASDIDTTLSQSITIPANGVCIGIAGSQANTTCTWTGLTEDADTTVESMNVSTASLTPSALQSGLTVTNSLNASAPAMALAAWDHA